MNDNESVNDWIESMKNGSEAAQRAVWERFIVPLTERARRHLTRAGGRRRETDEEDIVSSVFESVFKRAKAGRFSQLNDSQELWRLLLVITKRKVRNQVRKEGAQKRGGKSLRGESVFLNPNLSVAAGLDQLEAIEPSEADSIALAETVETFLGDLDPELQQIAVRRLQGFSTKEIATEISRSVATVERRLTLLRRMLDG